MDKLFYSEEYVIKKKNGQIMYVFPQIPYWMITRKKLEYVLEYFKKGASLECFFEQIVDDNQRRKEKQLLEVLIKKGILKSNTIKEENRKAKGIHIDNFIFGITNQCNLRCKSCYNSYENSLQEELTLDEMKEMVREVLPLLTYGFSISGGEPFCRKNDLIELVEYIAQLAPTTKIGIVTNGTLIDEETAQRLSSIPELTVQVSLDGITKDAHEFNRGRGTFEKALKGISILCKYNINVLLGVLITEKSISEIEDILKFADKHKLMGVRFIEMFWCGKSRSKDLKRPLMSQLLPIYRNILEKDINLAKLLQQDTVKITLESLINIKKKTCCDINGKSLYVDSNGNLYPCNLLVEDAFLYGNIRNKGIFEIIKESDICKELSVLSVDEMCLCKKCELKYFCGGGCRGIAFSAHNNIRAPLPNCQEKKENLYRLMWDFAEEESVYKLLEIK